MLSEMITFKKRENTNVIYMLVTKYHLTWDAERWEIKSMSFGGL